VAGTKLRVAAVAVLVTGLALIFVGRAAAAGPDPLYVGVTGCTDAGPGTHSQPYCTIQAAVSVVQPGQTVFISGTHDENVNVTVSGTSGSPITFQNSISGEISGAGSGITIDGRHDVVIAGLQIAPGGTGIAVSNSSDITLTGLTLLPPAADAVTYPAVIRLADVQNSLIASNVFSVGLKSPPGTAGPAISLDSATSNVTVKSNRMSATNVTQKASAAIDVAGPDNAVIDNTISQGAAAGILIEPGAARSVVADNVLSGNALDGIDDYADGTDITNNTLISSCATAINVGAAAMNTSVENNVVGYGTNACDSSATEHAAIGVFGSATATITVDYNVTDPAAGFVPYVWGTDQATLVAFRQASGQGQHDVEGPLNMNTATPTYASPAVDSANTAAPGYQPTDAAGKARVDDPYVADSGRGGVSYADRGAVEMQKSLLQASAGTNGRLVSLLTGNPNPSWQATFTDEGVDTWAPVTSFTVDYGDGSARVTRAAASTYVGMFAATESHVYTRPGNFVISITATDAVGDTGLFR
jgi:hypothetical protein